MSYDWTPEVAYPYGRGLKPCTSAEKPDLMFPDPADAEGIEVALMACALCDEATRQACLKEALSHSVSNDHGIWGGTTEKDRRRIRRERTAARKQASQPRVRPRPLRTCPRTRRWTGPTSLCTYAA